MNNNALDTYKKELSNGIAFSFGRTVLQTGIFDHRYYKPDDAPTMDAYFTDYQGEGENWKELPIEIVSDLEYEPGEPVCECHLPIGYSENGQFVRCSSDQVAQKFSALMKAIKQATDEQKAICYYATRGCADESGNFDEEYSEDCSVYIFPSEVIVVWSESYSHFDTVNPTPPQPTSQSDSSWISKLLHWFTGSQ